MEAYFASLSLLKLLKNMPGGIAQGLIWGLMALGIYISFRLLDVADLTVDGSFTTGGACAAMLILSGAARCAARGLSGRLRDGAAAYQARHSGDPFRHPYTVRLVFDQSAHYGHGGE